MAMKKYFAKHLQVEGEIKEGDFLLVKKMIFKCLTIKGNNYQALYISGRIPEGHAGRIYKEGEIASLRRCPNDLVKKLKLFLCSRDIKVGDEFILPEEYVKFADLGTNKVICSEVSNEVFHYSYEGNDGLKFTSHSGVFKKDNPYKIIGEISTNAIWVKEGNEFDEEEVAIASNKRTKEGRPRILMTPLNDNIFNILERTATLKENFTIQVKCQTCKTFH